MLSPLYESGTIMFFSEAQVEPFQATNSRGKTNKQIKNKHISSYVCSICMITVLALNLWLF